MRSIDADRLIEWIQDLSWNGRILTVPDIEFICNELAKDINVPNNGWISVKDRLPERPDGYPKCGIRRCYFLVALESGCVKSLGFEFDTMEWHVVGSPVTHWMPLPEPPKEDIEECR